MRVLPASFYKRDTETVARELLGCRLVHSIDGISRVSGYIIETEAYLGIGDPACHTFGDRRSPRTRSMYLPGGHAYVYFIYGLHYCFNVVTLTERDPEAVLIRSLEPDEGVDEMLRRRGLNATSLRTASLRTASTKTASTKSSPYQLTNGPAKLCQALGIDRSCDGLNLRGPQLFIEEARQSPHPTRITTSPRIGVDYAQDAATWPLRFQLSR